MKTTKHVYEISKKPIYRVYAVSPDNKKLIVYFDFLPALSRTILRFVKDNGGKLLHRRQHGSGVKSYLFSTPTARLASKLAKIMDGSNVHEVTA